MKRILILEDNKERRSNFERAARELGAGFEVKFWDDPAQMARDCEKYFPYAALISLEHDLQNPHGTGLDLAKFLAEKRPVCPVLIHTANSERCFSMINELRFAEWTVDRVPPIGGEWIDRRWLPRAQQLIQATTAPNTTYAYPEAPGWASSIPIAWREPAEDDHHAGAVLAA
jgi:hypothetical protein